MGAERLSDAAIAAALGGIPGWQREKNALRRTYSFPDFSSAIAFVNHVGALAEAADHHPDIDLRYTRVMLALSTHSAGGITQKDIDLARRIDGF